MSLLTKTSLRQVTRSLNKRSNLLGVRPMFVRGTDDAPKQTGFKKKKSDKKGTDGLTEQNRLMKMWERFGN
jgi:hypothetical protein